MESTLDTGGLNTILRIKMPSFLTHGTTNILATPVIQIDLFLLNHQRCPVTLQNVSSS